MTGRILKAGIWLVALLYLASGPARGETLDRLQIMMGTTARVQAWAESRVVCERAVQGAFDVEDLATVDGIVRILEIAVLDTLGLENSIARARALGYLAAVGLKALEVGELAGRLTALEALTRPTAPTRPSIFEVEPTRVDVAEAAS